MGSQQSSDDTKAMVKNKNKKVRSAVTIIYTLPGGYRTYELSMMVFMAASVPKKKSRKKKRKKWGLEVGGKGGG